MGSSTSALHGQAPTCALMPILETQELPYLMCMFPRNKPTPRHASLATPRATGPVTTHTGCPARRHGDAPPTGPAIHRQRSSSLKHDPKLQHPRWYQQGDHCMLGGTPTGGAGRRCHLAARMHARLLPDVFQGQRLQDVHHSAAQHSHSWSVVAGHAGHHEPVLPVPACASSSCTVHSTQLHHQPRALMYRMPPSDSINTFSSGHRLTVSKCSGHQLTMCGEWEPRKVFRSTADHMQAWQKQGTAQ